MSEKEEGEEGTFLTDNKEEAAETEEEKAAITAKMQQINSAWETLQDDDLRAAYDKRYKDWCSETDPKKRFNKNKSH